MSDPEFPFFPKSRDSFSEVKKETQSPFPSSLLSEEGHLNGSDFSFTDEIDHQILMHRDAHFGRNFQVMLDYYEGDHLGVQPEIDLERIGYLLELEQENGQDLAPLVLTPGEIEQVAKSLKAYRQLKALYTIENEKTPVPRLIADLILSEQEDPEEEIEAVVAQGAAAVPLLITLLQADDAFDPLYPGYGFAPLRAIVCLGRIKDTKAIVPLFETLSGDLDFEEDVILEAFQEIGEPAKQFLIKVLESRPLTADNLHAAFALGVFANDEAVAICCLKQLQDPDVQERLLLSTYLLCNCEGLRKKEYQESFKQLATSASFPVELKKEMSRIISSW